MTTECPFIHCYTKCNRKHHSMLHTDRGQSSASHPLIFNWVWTSDAIQLKKRFILIPISGVSFAATSSNGVAYLKYAYAFIFYLGLTKLSHLLPGRFVIGRNWKHFWVISPANLVEYYVPSMIDILLGCRCVGKLVELDHCAHNETRKSIPLRFVSH